MCLLWPVGLTASPARAAAPAPAATAPKPKGEDPGDAIANASDAWAKGDWPAVRGILEPLVDAPEGLEEPHQRTRALLLLADGTLNDVSIDAAERRRLAASYLSRQMDADAAWRMPPDIYTKALYDLYVDVSGERSRQQTDRCLADLMACRSDVRNAAQDFRELQAKHDKLQADYDNQEVEVRDRVARSRIFAAIPFGIGHYYNGDIAIGASFTAVEAGAGVTGLSLLLYRVIADGCRRGGRGFRRGALVCSTDNRDSIIARRKTEEVMAWIFYVSVAIDIVVAQALFKPFETENVRRIPRNKLNSPGSTGRRRRPRHRRSNPRAQVRPTFGGSRQGAGLGVSIQF